MASYPTTAVTFPVRADGQTIFSAHMNLVQEEIAAMEAALITAAGQTNAEVRIRRAGNCLEWGHVNPAGYGNMLGSEAGTGLGFIALHGEAGTNPGTYRTRGIQSTIIRGESGIFTIGYAATPSADNQTRQEYFRVGFGGISERGRTTPIGGWIVLTHPAIVFSSDTGTWVVDLADFVHYRYTLIGNTCIINFYFANTTITGTPQILRFAAPVMPTATTRSMVSVINNAAQVQPGVAVINAGDQRVHVYKDNSLPLYAASANLTTLLGQLVYEF